MVDSKCTKDAVVSYCTKRFPTLISDSALQGIVSPTIAYNTQNNPITCALWVLLCLTV